MSHWGELTFFSIGPRLNKYITLTDTLCFPGLFIINVSITCKNLITKKSFNKLCKAFPDLVSSLLFYLGTTNFQLMLAQVKRLQQIQLKENDIANLAKRNTR